MLPLLLSEHEYILPYKLSLDCITGLKKRGLDQPLIWNRSVRALFEWILSDDIDLIPHEDRVKRLPTVNDHDNETLHMAPCSPHTHTQKKSNVYRVRVWKTINRSSFQFFIPNGEKMLLFLHTTPFCCLCIHVSVRMYDENVEIIDRLWTGDWLICVDSSCSTGPLCMECRKICKYAFCNPLLLPQRHTPVWSRIRTKWTTPPRWGRYG